MTKKVKDNKNRWRSKTIAFRISPEENQQLETKVKLSGLTKQDYIIRRCLEKEIVVYGNSRVHKALIDKLSKLTDELVRVADVSSLPQDYLEAFEALVMTAYGMGEEGVNRIRGMNEILERHKNANDHAIERRENYD